MKYSKLLIALSFIFSLYTNAQTKNGIIYNFRFNGNLSDSITSTYGFGMARGTNPVYTTDRNNNVLSALALTAKTSATLQFMPQAKSARTISLWFKLNYANTSTAEQYIFSYGTEVMNQAFGFSIQPLSGTVKLYGWANDILGYYTFNKTEWYNLVVTYNGVNAAVYINGSQIINQPVSAWSTVGYDFTLGETPGGYLNSFNNIYDDIRIYDRVLSYAEILGIYGTIINPEAIKQSVYSYYSFDNNLSNQNNEMTLIERNTVSQVAGKEGIARSFTGANCLYSTEYLPFFDETNATKPFTISFWAKATATNSYATMVELFGNYFIRYKINGRAEIGYLSNTLNWYTYESSTTMINLNTWQHITMVHDPATQKDYFYVNGVYINAFNNYQTKVVKSNSILSIGGGTDVNGNFLSSKNFSGIIDELYIFNEALNSDEVKYIFKTPDLMTATALKSPLNTTKVRVYPNPCSELVQFDTNNSTKKELWSIQGNKILETYENSVNIKNFPNGIYIVKFIDNKELTATVKLVKK